MTGPYGRMRSPSERAAGSPPTGTMARRLRHLGAALALILGSLAPAIVARAQAPGIAPGQAILLAGNCFGCHGTGGVAPPDSPIPSIAGMPAAAMVERLKAFQADLVPEATIMKRIALGYTDAEIAAIAGYFAGGN